MKKILFGAIVAWILVAATLATALDARANGATTFLADFSNFSFFNTCSNENVLTEEGSYLHGVLRFDVDSGLHTVNRSAGQIFANGVISGEEYLVTMTNEAVPLNNVPTGINVTGGNGSINILNTLHIVKPSDPDIGVFIANVVIVLTVQDGVLVSRVFSITGECR